MGYEPSLGVCVMPYCSCMGYSMHFPVNQLSGPKKVCVMREYGLSELCVMKELTVLTNVLQYTLWLLPCSPPPPPPISPSDSFFWLSTTTMRLNTATNESKWLNSLVDFSGSPPSCNPPPPPPPPTSPSDLLVAFSGSPPPPCNLPPPPTSPSDLLVAFSGSQPPPCNLPPLPTSPSDSLVTFSGSPPTMWLSTTTNKYIDSLVRFSWLSTHYGQCVWQQRRQQWWEQVWTMSGYRWVFFFSFFFFSYFLLTIVFSLLYIIPDREDI